MNTSQSNQMDDQHRATDSEWYCIEARTCGDKADAVAYSCILELRDRIKALEAAQPANSNHPEIPGGSLVDRVACAITGVTGDSDGPINWKPEARAAIREVVAWLRKNYGTPTATTYLLEQESER